MNSAENLGEALRGDRIENSVYIFKMIMDEGCKVVCRKKLTAEAAKNFMEKVDGEYQVNMILDNLPVAVPRQRQDGSQITSYEHGFRVGYKIKDDVYYINNHVSFKVMYHKDLESDDSQIVGFEVIPSSQVKLNEHLVGTHLFTNDDQIHWFSIVNSLMIVLSLSGMVAMIMMGTLYRDISTISWKPRMKPRRKQDGN